MRGSWAEEAGGRGSPSTLWEGRGDVGGSYWKRDEPAVMRGRTEFPLPRVERDILKIVGDLQLPLTSHRKMFSAINIT